MKLWKLEFCDSEFISRGEGVYEFIIRADTELQARKIACKNAEFDWVQFVDRQTNCIVHNFDGGDVWLDDKFTTCIEVDMTGPADVICAAWGEG